MESWAAEEGKEDVSENVLPRCASIPHEDKWLTTQHVKHEGSNRTHWHSVIVHARVPVEKVRKNAHKRKHIIRHSIPVWLIQEMLSVSCWSFHPQKYLQSMHKLQSSVMDSGISLKSLWSLAKYTWTRAVFSLDF